MHCFVDLQFAHKNNLTSYSVSLIVLRLFDGTSNFVITQAVDLSVKFPASGVGGGWVLLLPQVRHARPRGFWRSGRAPRDWGD